MTVGQLRAIYGSALHLETKAGYEPVYTAVVDGPDATELVFVSSFELTRPLVDTDVIAWMGARPKTDWIGGDGC